MRSSSEGSSRRPSIRLRRWVVVTLCASCRTRPLIRGQHPAPQLDEAFSPPGPCVRARAACPRAPRRSLCAVRRGARALWRDDSAAAWTCAPARTPGRRRDWAGSLGGARPVDRGAAGPAEGRSPTRPLRGLCWGRRAGTKCWIAAGARLYLASPAQERLHRHSAWLRTNAARLGPSLPEEERLERRHRDDDGLCPNCCEASGPRAWRGGVGQARPPPPPGRWPPPGPPPTGRPLRRPRPACSRRAAPAPPGAGVRGGGHALRPASRGSRRRPPRPPPSWNLRSLPTLSAKQPRRRRRG